MSSMNVVLLIYISTFVSKDTLKSCIIFFLIYIKNLNVPQKFFGHTDKINFDF